MKSIRFLADFFSVDSAGNSFVKYAKGGIYSLDDETSGQVAAGFAEEVDTPESPPAAAQTTSPAVTAPKAVATGVDGA